MNPDAEKFWQEVAPRLRRHLQLMPPTLREAEAEYAAAPEVPISEDDVKAALAFAKTGRRSRPPAPPQEQWVDDQEMEAVQDEMELVLNRNAGECDERAKALLEELREKALEEEGQRDGDEEPSGDAGEAEEGKGSGGAG